jgi:hypothetical protein
MNTLTADVRSASRALATARGFTAIAVTTRAAGIALSAVVLTVLNAYVVRGLPYPDPGIVMRSLHALRQRRGRNPACTHFHDNSTPHSTAKPTAGYAVRGRSTFWTLRSRTAQRWSAWVPAPGSRHDLLVDARARSGTYDSKNDVLDVALDRMDHLGAGFAFDVCALAAI